MSKSFLPVQAGCLTYGDAPCQNFAYQIWLFFQIWSTGKHVGESQKGIPGSYPKDLDPRPYGIIDLQMAFFQGIRMDPRSTYACCEEIHWLAPKIISLLFVDRSTEIIDPLLAYCVSKKINLACSYISLLSVSWTIIPNLAYKFIKRT